MKKYKFKIVDKHSGSCIVHPNSKFYRKYFKDEYVYAEPDTLGVMLFKTRAQAQQFIDYHQNALHGEFLIRSRSWKIKRVIPIGRGKTPEHVSFATSSYGIKDFNKKVQLYGIQEYMAEPVEGTICYPGVLVVD